MCIHLDYKINNHWQLQYSLYNGLAHKVFEKGNNVFSICPSQEGIFNISELSYQQNRTYHGLYSGGFTIHNRLYSNNENGEQTLEEKKINFSRMVLSRTMPVQKESKRDKPPRTVLR